jgi:dipeptidyl aminopeptidase/acylaminoacyl peptidase
MKRIIYIILVFMWCSATPYAQEILSPEGLWKLGRLSDPQVSPDAKTVIYGVTRYRIEDNKGKRSLYGKKINGGEANCLTCDMEASVYNARWRPDGQKIGFLTNTSDKMQLWEMNPDGTDKQQVSDFEKSISNFSYAPDGGHIAFTMLVKLDSTVNDMYPDLPHADARIIDDLMYRHWDSWHDYQYSYLFYAPYNDGEVTGGPVDVMEGEKFDTPLNPFGGAEHITWSPDGKKLVYVSKKSTGKEYALSTNSDLYQYDLQSRETVNITEGMDGYDTDPVFSPNGETLAWLSMARPGFESDKNVIWLMDTQSGLKRSATGNVDMSASHVRWDEDSEKVYFIGGVEATYQVFAMEVNNLLDSRREVPDAEPVAITKGIHNYYDIVVADNQLIGTKASMSQPIELFRIDVKNGGEEIFTVVNKEQLDATEMGKVEKRIVKTTDGKDMLTWVIYPPDFDPEKKYPALLYCQGGPQSAVSQFFSYRWNFQLMAAHGYIVVAPNRRGLPTFGQDWNDQISGDWGGQAMKDYLAAIDEVAKEPYVDENRLGAVGASYGGYSVYYLAGIHEGRFKTFTDLGIY